MLQTYIIMLHADINKSNVNKIMLHVTIIYLACMGQKYAEILSCTFKQTSKLKKHMKAITS